MNLVEVFEDTLKQITDNPQLQAATTFSINNVKLYGHNQLPQLPGNRRFDTTKLSISKDRSFATAATLAKNNPGAKIAVLNFANAIHPGGGVTRGAQAQEESLCRCSTLYPTLVSKDMLDNYYHHNAGLNREMSDNNNACIYSPEIIVFKSDTASPELLPEKKWCTVDVLTCAAPCPLSHKIPNEQLFTLHMDRARHLMQIAWGNKVDILILGAFGCGAFRNDPQIVAQAYKEVLPEFSGVFKEISFAIYCSSYETINYTTFKNILEL